MKSLAWLAILALAGCGDSSTTDLQPTGTFAPVDTSGDVAGSAALAFDTSSHPFIVYRTLSTLELKCAFGSGLSWQIETVTADNPNDHDPAFAISPANVPHVAYRHGASSTDATFTISTRNAASWESQVVDPTMYAGFHSSLAFGSDGSPCVAYSVGYPDYDLRFARLIDGAWRTELVDADGHVGYGACLVMNPAGMPCISYGSSGDEQIRLAEWTGSEWRRSIIATNRYALSHHSLATRNGSLSIAYRTGTNLDDTDLAYGSLYNPGWHQVTIDTDGDVGYNPSLVVDDQGDSWIAYRNGHGRLGIALQHRGKWSLHDLPDGGEGVINSNLAFDGSGRLGISLHHFESGRLSFGWIDKVGRSEPVGPIP